MCEQCKHTLFCVCVNEKVCVIERDVHVFVCVCVCAYILSLHKIV